MKNWNDLFKSSLLYLKIAIGILLILVGFLFIEFFSSNSSSKALEEKKAYIPIDSNFNHLWTAPSDWRLGFVDSVEKVKILYGKELIINTALYLGPQGTVKSMSNGMNCQNCHLKAGTQPWGNNYFSVASTYPQVRKRSGKMTTIADRINGCFTRSLNGEKLDTNSYEMQSMVAYIKWLGKDVKKGRIPKGSKLFKLALLDRAADPEKGKGIYETKCVSCHQTNGQGVKNADGKSYQYPPLWGQNSYNDGAGLSRISNFASYVRFNMPLGADYTNPQLTEEEAWDLAAFVNSQPRPNKDWSKDWPKMADKPMDHPFGPYVDPYSEKQHKYGPFKPIIEFYKH